MQYTWRDGYRAKIGAEEAGEALAELAQQNGGLTAASVVEAARDPQSPLHAVFEWDDTEAAHAYRLSQARTLVASVRIISDKVDEPETLRAYVVVQNAEGRHYHDTREALSDAEMRVQVLQRALRDLKRWRTRYAEFEELAEVITAATQAAATAGFALQPDQ